MSNKNTKKTRSTVAVTSTDSAGSVLVRDVCKWMQSFVAMPDEYAIVCAVFAAFTHVYRRFDSTPYVSITSAEPQAGKSTLLHTLSALAHHGEAHTDPTKATIFGLIQEAEEKDRGVTIGWDECEKAARESDDRREVINSGYQATGSVLRANPAHRSNPAAPATIRLRTFCPKILAGIGTLAPTIKDRSIMLLMRRGKAPRRYIPSVMRAEAAVLAERIADTVSAVMPTGAPVRIVDCEWLDGREWELWQPLFTMARYLALDADQCTLLRRACDLLIELKHTDATGRYTMLRQHEDRQALASGVEPIGRVALRAMRDAFGADDRVHTVTLIERMRNADATWAQYRGKGITRETLASLVATFGIVPRQIKIAGKNANGYKRADVDAALDRFNV